MTQTEQWIMELALVYAVPSFLSGVAVTLLCVRWPEIRRALANMSARRWPHMPQKGLDLA